jgi:SAM-dependent methyltransferase
VSRPAGLPWKQRAFRLVSRMSPSLASYVRSVARPSERLLGNPYVVGKLLDPAHGDVVVLKPEPPDPDHLPVPPRSLWEGYGETANKYLESGRADIETMLGILRASGADPTTFGRVLDFGCAAGRMLRWFPRDSAPELWGADIQGEAVRWCQLHLSPPMDFVTATTAPSLPFEDSYFDLIYAGSVFTHIVDLPDAWLLELRRMLHSGGYCFVTVLDKHGLKLILEGEGRFNRSRRVQFIRDLDARRGVLSQDFAYFSVEPDQTWGQGMPVPQVCYDIDYLMSRWSRVMDVVSVTQSAYGLQTAVLLRKR